METLCQQQDGGYALLWKRYVNNNMAGYNVKEKTRSSIYDSTVTFDVITDNFVPSQLILNVYG